MGDFIDALGLRRPLPRREFLRLVAEAGGLAAIAAACGGGDGGGPTGTGSPTGGPDVIGEVPGPQPVSGGTPGGRIIAGYSTQPDSNDPALSYDLFSYDMVTMLVFFGGILAYGGQTGGPVANLADMPEVSSDNRTLTFNLRPGVRFHNGREVEADDIKWTWERVCQPATGAWGSTYFLSVEGIQDVFDEKTDALEGLEVVDSKTLKVHLSQPDFTFLNTCCQPFAAPVPREEVNRLGDEFGRTPVGFGPFMIESYDDASQTVRLVRFEDYFYEGLPYADEVEMHWGVEPQTLLLQVSSGAIDLIADSIPGTLLGQAQSDPALENRLVTAPVLQNLMFQMNVNNPPFDDVRVRQALNWAVNRDNIARVLHGSVSPNGKPFPLGIANYTPVFDPYTYDPERAKELLAEAGFGDGFEMTLTTDVNPPWPDIAQVVQQDLQSIGADVSIDAVRFNVYHQLRKQGRIDMWPSGWYMIQPTPADMVDAEFITGASSNYMEYSNPEVDTLAEQARAEFDEAARNQNYAQIEELIGEDAPGIFLVSSTYTTAVSERLHNWHLRGELGNYYDRMWVS